MRTLHLILIVAFILLMLVFAFAVVTWPADAQPFDCDLSGAAYAEVTLRTPRRTVETRDAGVMREPEAWGGESTWVGYEAGGLTAAHLNAGRYADVRYFDAAGEWMHWISVKADADAVYVMIMPANLRDGIYTHGCAAFRDARGGAVETWLVNLEGDQ